MHLWWLGQSGFLLSWEGRHLLLDPYLSDSLTRKYAGSERPHVRMTRRVVEPQRLAFVDAVTSSHNHTDHLDAETLAPILAAGATLVCPGANVDLARRRCGVDPVGIAHGETRRVAGFRLEAVPAAHDQLAPEYAGFVVTAGPFRVYHSGDTVLYDGMGERLRAQSVDVAVLPINGKLGNMDGRDAARLAREMGARLAVPCHFEMFEFNTARPDEFAGECERLRQPYRVLRAGERLTIDERVASDSETSPPPSGGADGARHDQTG